MFATFGKSKSESDFYVFKLAGLDHLVLTNVYDLHAVLLVDLVQEVVFDEVDDAVALDFHVGFDVDVRAREFLDVLHLDRAVLLLEDAHLPVGGHPDGRDVLLPMLEELDFVFEACVRVQRPDEEEFFVRGLELRVADVVARDVFEFVVQAVVFELDLLGAELDGHVFVFIPDFVVEPVILEIFTFLGHQIHDLLVHDFVRLVLLFDDDFVVFQQVPGAGVLQGLGQLPLGVEHVETPGEIGLCVPTLDDNESVVDGGGVVNVLACLAKRLHELEFEWTNWVQNVFNGLFDCFEFCVVLKEIDVVLGCDAYFDLGYSQGGLQLEGDGDLLEGGAHLGKEIAGLHAVHIAVFVESVRYYFEGVDDSFISFEGNVDSVEVFDVVRLEKRFVNQLFVYLEFGRVHRLEFPAFELLLDLF